MFLRFVFPPPPSLLVTAMSVVSFASMANAGLSELKGKHMEYSKFWEVKSGRKYKVDSRTGMIVCYTPAFLAGVASFALFPDESFRFLLLTSALSIHFFKRIFEVLFVHKYSGGMALDAAIVISLSYFISTATMIYGQHLSRDFPEPLMDLKYPGIALFFVGILGNLYHHCQLSKLRSKGEREYKIPKGGLFNLVVCPHYLFEILGFIGFSFISQTVYAFALATGTALYLMGRSYSTRRWYVSKFENFPNNVKALIPYIL